MDASMTNFNYFMDRL